MMKLLAATLVLCMGVLACDEQEPPPELVPKPEVEKEVVADPTTITEADYPQTIDPKLAERFATLALTCVHQEYPNKISRTIGASDELGTPKELFPVFYGCFDWHSAVHGHWLLVRLLRLGAQDASWREQATAALDESFSEAHVSGEVANFDREHRGSWERPYGLAWFLQLTAELREWNTEKSEAWLKTLRPLEERIVASLKGWLPKLAYPIRLGTHNQTAFAFGLIYDWAKVAKDDEMLKLIVAKSTSFHAADVSCPMAYEPSGEDFLSPCLMEADLMRRILQPAAYQDWLSKFLPGIPKDGSADWITPGIVKDATDGKLVHLDGVNSSRAWNLYNIARALPKTDPRIVSIVAAAKVHQKEGVAAVSNDSYSGSHWLASFATYLMTDRGAQ